MVVEELVPIQKRYQELMGDVAELDRLLARGADHARSISEPKLMEMKRRVGFVLPNL